jgi:hypothetical protein
VVFGKPVDYSEFVGRERSKETAQQIVDKMIGILRGQLAQVRRLRAGEITRQELLEWLGREGARVR